MALDGGLGQGLRRDPQREALSLDELLPLCVTNPPCLRSLFYIIWSQRAQPDRFPGPPSPPARQVGKEGCQSCWRRGKGKEALVPSVSPKGGTAPP